MKECRHESGRFQWNAGGWFGAQIGSTCWLLFSGVTFLYGKAPTPAALLLGCFVLANAIGTGIWVNRRKIDPYQGLQILVLLVFLLSTIAVAGTDYLGFLGDLEPRLKYPRMIYLCLLVFPALMAMFHFQNKLKPTDTQGHGGFMGLPATGPASELKSFTMSDPTIATEVIAREDDAWRITSGSRKERIRLFEVPDPGVENCMLVYRAQLKTEGVGRRAYLEMWCRFSRREFFSQGFAFHGLVTGTSDWAVYETPFYLQQGQKPSLVKLNLVVEGGGTVWVKDVQLLLAPLKQDQQVTAS